MYLQTGDHGSRIKHPILQQHLVSGRQKILYQKRYLHGSTRCLRCEKEPHLTNVEVKMRLKNCARNLNLPKYQQGWGMIDVNLLLT